MSIIRKTSETRPLASHTVNAYSESESNAYSCDYVNGALIYSTDEVNTHKKWIDGKDIYRKIINFGTLPNTTTKSIAHNISNLDTMISMIGCTKRNDGTRFPIPYVPGGTNIENIAIYSNNTSVIIYCGVDRTEFNTTYITLEYTKTTDTVQSTRSLNTYGGDIEEKKDIVIDDGEEEKPIDDGNNK